MSDKIDFKRALDCYQAKQGTFCIIEVPDMQYMAIDGHGDPNTSTAYVQSLEALYPLAYTLKFMSKSTLDRDYVVPPLEGLWWAPNMDAFTFARDKSQWHWTLMIMVPEWIHEEMFESAVAQVGSKASRPARLTDVKLRDLTEGRCVQTLHVGPYDDEAEILERMHRTYIPDNGLVLDGTHHEIYLSDPRRVAPDKLRTILRQPVVASPSPA